MKVEKKDFEKEVATIIEKGILKELSGSVKDKTKMMTIWIISSVISIIGLVLIVIFG